MQKEFEDNELESYYTRAYQSLDEATNSDHFGAYLLSRVKSGQKEIFNKTQTEVRNFDMSFLDVIESTYPAILKIMRDPKKSIRYDEEIVAVEKARKINSDTVRHLSSHTQLIKEIKDDGDVIPSKVLTTFAEEEIAIYENRFIKSLVKRMEMFLERRYDVMKTSLESFETERLNVKDEFLVSGQKVTVGIDIEIKNDLTVNIETTKEQFNRLVYVREIVQGLKGYDFMRALAKTHDVLPPIMKTNIIMHNPDFRMCYQLWLYLDQVDGISTNVDVKEKNYRFSQAFDEDINKCMTLALTSFIKNREIEGIYSSKKLPSIKAPKPIKNDSIELEMNLKSDNNKLEDYKMNEVLLSETAKYFDSSMTGLEKSGATYNESVRVVYRQMLDMLDQIFPKVFRITNEELETKDPYEQQEYIRRRQMILKIVKAQKQMNIARMGKEEKRLEKLQAKIDTQIKSLEEQQRIKEEKAEARKIAEEKAIKEREAALKAKRKKIEDEAKAKEEKAIKAASNKSDTDKVIDAKKARAQEIARKKRQALKDAKNEG